MFDLYDGTGAPHTSRSSDEAVRRHPAPDPERIDDDAPEEEPEVRPAPRRRRRPATTAESGAPAERVAANGRQGVSKPQPVRRTGSGEGLSLRKIFTDVRTRIFFGVLLGLATVYLLIVTISYFSNMVHDQSAVLSNTFATLATTPEKVTNAGGPLGAWLSEMIISQWMGVGSFILIAYLVGLSLSLLRVRKVRFWPFTFRCLLTTVATSVVLGLITYETSSPFYWGGRHGYLFNEMLVRVSGIWGAICVSVVMVALVGVLFFNSLYRTYRRLRVVIGRAAHRRRLEQEARQAEAERLEAERAAREAAEEAERRKQAREAEARAAAEVPAPAPASAPAYTAPVAPVAPAAPAPAAASPSAPAAVQQDVTDMEHDDQEDDFFTGAPDDADPAEIPVVDMDEPEMPERPEHLEAPTAIMTLGGMEIKSPQIEKADKEVISKAEEENALPEDTDLYDPRLDLSRYQMPGSDLLVERQQKANNVDAEEQEENKQRIIETLRNYGIEISSIKATVGPTVTLYEIIPAEGVRISRIKNLEDDIALSLSALGIRIIAPIPGKGTVGIEVPNKDPQTVSIRSVLESKTFIESKMELPMALGCTISNEVFMADLAKMPHLLVAGATGMGKSVGLNTIIASLLYKKHPAELKFVLVDPKMVEFSLYAGLDRHYLAKLPGEDEPIITDTSKVVATLNSLCKEMDDRYMLLRDANCRNIMEYNTKFTHRTLNPEKGHRFLPYIVVIVDEFADLLMTAGKEVETPIARIAQKARAVGIHMILATQRPSANIITGVIKANFPGRIAFRVFQMVDSRTILDSPGANQLIGKGDMLFSNSGRKDRVQCAFIDTPEVEALCRFISDQQGYDGPYELPEYVPEDVDPQGMTSLGDRDPLFEDVARDVVLGGNTASTSKIQRRYSIGFNRAGRIMDQLENAGVVGPAVGGKPRQVLIDAMQLERLLEMPS
ncbi:MAG: DNA translocase FtsK [Bacteroides sp.]|nr:DNA translocase FtsK [Bacteroides sp.]